MEYVIPAVGLDLGNSLTNVVAGWTRKKANWFDLPTEVAHLPAWSPEPKYRLEETLFGNFKGACFQSPTTCLVGKGASLDETIPVSRPGKTNHKVATDELFLAGLAGIAKLAIERFGFDVKTEKATVRIRALGVSLPWAQYDEDKDTLVKRLTGTHRLELPALAKIGRLEMTIIIDRVIPSPEGLPALMAQAYSVDPKSDKLLAAHPELLKSIVGVVDVGGGTTDILLFDVKFRLLRGSCDTLQYGINDALKKAHSKLVSDGWSVRFPTLAALVEHIRDGRWEVEGKGNSALNLHDYLDEHLIPLAGTISAEINNRWTQAVQYFLLVGGGAPLLGPMLKLREGSVPDTPKNPEWQTAMGNYIVARLALGERP